MKILKWFFLLPFFPIFASDAYCQIYSLTTQRANPIVGALLVGENTEMTNHFKVNPERNAVICEEDGVYFISFSLQPAVLNFGINGHLGAWIEVNQEPLTASTSRIYVTQDSPIAVMTTASLIKLKSGDSIGTRFATTGYDIGVTYIQSPSPEEGAIPSYTLSVMKVD
jgi:hypothetical protein